MTMTPKEAALAVEKLLTDAGYHMTVVRFSEALPGGTGRHEFETRSSSRKKCSSDDIHEAISAVFRSREFDEQMKTRYGVRPVPKP